MIRVEPIIFDAQVLQTPANNRGMGNYIKSLLQALAASGQKAILFENLNLLGSIKDMPELRHKNIKIHSLDLKTQHAGKNFASTSRHNQQVLDTWLETQGIREPLVVLCSLFQVELAPAYPSNGTHTAIMYDIIPLQQYEQYAPRMKWDDYLARFKLVFASDKILCISKTVASDMQAYTGLHPRRLCVIDGGAQSSAQAKAPQSRPKSSFILAPTGNDIRKNNENAVIGFQKFVEQSGLNYTLCLTSVFEKDEQERLHNLSPNLFFTGVLDTEELGWYQQNCEAVLFASTYEGLGMPIIEAIQEGKPVAASRIPVLLEISETAPYYFDPLSSDSIAEALRQAVKGKVARQKDEYERVIQEYCWERSAQKLLHGLEHMPNRPSKLNKKVAIIGPHVAGVSAVGKFVARIYPELSRQLDVDYFYEVGGDVRHIRPDLLSSTTNYRSLYELSKRQLESYDAVIYHIGNGNQHSLTAARALTVPSIVVLHDLNLTNIFEDLAERGLISQSRLEAENKINQLRKDDVTSYVYSVASRQQALIVHSDYSRQMVSGMTDKETSIELAQLTVETPIYCPRPRNDRFTIGLGGIIATIKGLDEIERLASRPEHLEDRFIIFGLNYAEPGALVKLQQLSNVEILTDLSDFEFQQTLKNLDVLINYRQKYQGEASCATLEAMCYGLPVIVRGDFGWYSEIPDGAVVKVNSPDQISKSLDKLKQDQQWRQQISDNARLATEEIYGIDQYVEAIVKLVNQVSGR